MGKSVPVMTLASAIGLALLGSGFQSAAAAPLHANAQTATVGAQTSGSEVYIITFAEPGMLYYKGDVAGLAATAPSRTAAQRKLDVRSPAAQAYGNYLETQRQAYRSAMENAIGRPLAVTHSYSVTLNGIAATLSAAEAARIASVPGVRTVKPAGVEHLVTYRGPTFIGANTIWDGSNTPSHVGTRGEGILFGDLDGGTNSSLPLFANDPACGFDESHPKLVAVDCSSSSGGVCNGPNPEANPGFGHGVHTSSTVAGDTIDNTADPAPLIPDGVTMSGVAPCAAIHHYKVCQTNSCGGADILAGIQNAIADQVDVLNFSISGGTSPWSDNDRNFLDAVNADVFVAAAAGNNSSTDPTVIGMVNHRGPWVITVAASTQDEIIGPQLAIDGPGSPPAGLDHIPLNPGNTTVTANTTDLSAFPILSYPTNIEGCTDSGGFPADYFAGTIALIRRGTCPFTEKITNAYNAGATMVVIGNNQAGSINMDTTGSPDVPAFSIGDMATADALIAFVNANPGHPTNPDVVFADGFEDNAGTAAGATADFSRDVLSSRQGDVLADFSYRGPTPGNLADETKPDISAPGVDIYAGLDPQDGNYGFMSGTSMATPHITGSGALIRAVHPDWTVTEVKSALMTTATNADGTEEDGTTPWNIDDVGSGRVDLTKAALVGLTFDETYANYVAANPATGGDVKTLNLPALRNMGCDTSCTWTRTVKNRLSTSGTWNVTSTTPSSYTVAASPSSFTLAPGATQTITFTATPASAITAIAFGTVTMHENAGQSPDQHLTVAIKATTGGGGGGDPGGVTCTGGSCTLQIDGLPDTGGSFNSLGCGATDPCTFLWLNQFTPDANEYPLNLTSVDTIFSSTGTSMGDSFDLFIYQDDNNDPSDGATLVKAVTGLTVTAQNQLQTITIPGGASLAGPGDVLIALSYHSLSPYPGGADDAVDFANHSWIGGLGEVIGSAPDLSQLGMTLTTDALPSFTHNWIIRGHGTGGSGQAVTLDPAKR
jgi:subtilisin family serine protease